MISPNRLISVILLTMLPLAVSAQQGDQTVYYNTTYRLVPVEKEGEFREFLADVIKPMFASEVERGRLTGWFAWRAHYVSEEESYNYIFSRGSTDLDSMEQVFDGGFAAAFQQVHGTGAEEVVARSRELSTMVKNELWEQSQISVLQSRSEPARWANVAYYHNYRQRDTTRDLLLQNVIAQFQLARINRGLSSGWAYFSRRFPFDTPESYDAAELVYYERFDQILGAGIGQQVWAGVRTDESSLSDNLDQLRETRLYIKRELWEMIDYVQ